MKVERITKGEPTVNIGDHLYEVYVDEWEREIVVDHREVIAELKTDEKNRHYNE